MVPPLRHPPLHRGASYRQILALASRGGRYWSAGWRFAIWNSGSALLRYHEKKRKFQRVQFRIGLNHFRQALIGAGIYSEDELEPDNGVVWESLGSHSSGYITFTWLQPDLFFMNTASTFSEFAELTISLKPLGRRAEELGKGFRL